jgi:hypothetical protein
MVNANTLDNRKKRTHIPIELFNKMVAEGILGDVGQENQEQSLHTSTARLTGKGHFPYRTPATQK